MKTIKTLALIGIAGLTTSVIAGSEAQNLRPPVVLGDTPAMTDTANDTAPNVLVVFDDSWSMNRPYAPDSLSMRDERSRDSRYWVEFTDDTDSWETEAARLDDWGHVQRASAMHLDTTQDEWAPPFLTSAFNKMTYNPEVTYLPPQVVGGISKLPAWARGLKVQVNGDVVTYPDMNKSNTANWTRIPVRHPHTQLVPDEGWWSDYPTDTWKVGQTTFYSLKGMYEFHVYTWDKVDKVKVTYSKTTTKGRGKNKETVQEITEERIDLSNVNNYGIRVNGLHDLGPRWRKFFINTEAPEVKQLLEFPNFCPNPLPEDFTTLAGCKAKDYLPLHYYRTSLKWCKDENPAYNKSTKKPRWPGTGKADKKNLGFADGYGAKFTSSCVAENDPLFDANQYRFPYFYAPLADVPGSKYYGQIDNTQYNPFIPVVFDFTEPQRIYTTEYVDEHGKLQTITRTFEEELTNYLNWFVYYGLREYALKTVASRVFATVPPETHVGIMKLSDLAAHWEDGPDTGLNITKSREKEDNLHVAAFTGEHRQKFYELLIKKMQGNEGTKYLPNTRLAAMAAGVYFKGPSSHGVMNTAAYLNNPWKYSPARYACQRNEVLFFTSGSWNDRQNQWFFGEGNNIDEKVGSLPDANVEILGKKLKAGDDWPRPINHGGEGTLAKTTLADIGLYYWSNNIQPALADGSKGKPFQLGSSSNDPATWPHLSFSAIGLGLAGSLSASNQTLTLNQIINGNVDWPDPWGENKKEDIYAPARIDDLWHMTVNSFGTYMPAQSPEEAERDLRVYLNHINSVGGSLASAQTSSNDLRPVIDASDTPMIYVPSFTADWSGDVKAYKVDTDSNKSGDLVWSAASKLKEMLTPTRAGDEPWFSKRRVITFATDNPGGNGVLNQAVEFKYENLSAAQLATLGQTAEVQKKVIAYLRGDQSNEGKSGGTFRQRSALLGDIINAELVFSGPPARSFDHTLNCGYEQYKKDNANRKKVIFAAANDGMLHAFDQKTGAELWAFMPANLIRPAEKGGIAGRVAHSLLSNDVERPGDTLVPVDPNLALPTSNENKVLMHRYYLDATPQLMDVQIDGDWKTLLIGGLGKGGSSYYAIDVSDPDNPLALWEYTDSNMGYTYGRPLLSKTPANAVSGSCNQNWIAILPSGLNNGRGRGQAKSGDGEARLYFRNLKDGSQWRQAIASNGGGTPGWPSGLGWIASYIDNEQIDQVARSVYGGDQRGGLWRFDLDHVNTENWHVSKVVNKLTDANGNVQPVSTRPALLLTRGKGVSVDGATRWVLTGSGRITSRADADSPIRNSFYAIRDGTRNAANSKVLNNRSEMTDVSAAARGVQPALKENGWYQDFAQGWHVITDPVAFGAKRADGTTARALVVYSAVHSPKWLSNAACTAQQMEVHTYFRDVATGELTYEYQTQGFPGTPELFYDKDGSLNIGISYGEEVKLFSWGDVGMPPVSGNSPDYSGSLQRYMMRFID